MDPLTHALVGAGLARVAFGRPLGNRAALVGGFAALLPDADVLIRSTADPLLLIEHHRGFTHSFAFAPLGAAVAAAPWYAGRSNRRRAGSVFGAALVGYASHGPLDAATTYGTRLFWPFSAQRVGLDWIAIVDPLFTVVLLVGLAWALFGSSARPAALALGMAAGYLVFGAVQRERALQAQAVIAQARGHTTVRAAAFPGFANNLVRRSLYQAGDSLYSDRLRVGWAGGVRWSPGSAVPLLREAELPAATRRDPRTLRDFRRFAWFSDGWVARAPADPGWIADARYSMRADAFAPVWGIRLDPSDAARPTRWVDRSRERRVDLAALWAEIRGTDPAYRPLPRRVRGR